MTATAHPEKRGAVDAVCSEKRLRVDSASEPLGVTSAAAEGQACAAEAEAPSDLKADETQKTAGPATLNAQEEEAEPDEESADQAWFYSVTEPAEKPPENVSKVSESGKADAKDEEASNGNGDRPIITDESSILDLLPGESSLASPDAKAADAVSVDQKETQSPTDVPVASTGGKDAVDGNDSDSEADALEFEECEEEMLSDDDIVASPVEAIRPKPVPAALLEEVAPPLPRVPDPSKSLLRRRPAASLAPDAEVGPSEDASGSSAPSKRIKFVSVTEETHDAIAANITSIVNHRGHDLWFTMPGQQVECSHCERLYPQVFGRLCGADGRSQMSQTDFICMNCMSADFGLQDDRWQEMLMQADESNEEEAADSFDGSQDGLLDDLDDDDDDEVEEGDVDEIVAEAFVDTDPADTLVPGDDDDKENSGASVGEAANNGDQDKPPEADDNDIEDTSV